MKGMIERGSARVSECNFNNIGQFTLLMVLSRICIIFFALICTPQLACSQQILNSGNPETGSSVDSLTRRPFGSLPIRIGFSYGWSNRLNSINGNGNSQINDFEEALQSGDAIRASLIYFAEGNFGMGVKYSHFFTSHEAGITIIDEQGLERTINLSEEINARFFGLSVMHREPIGKKFEFSLSLAAGALFLKSELEGLTIFPITFSGDSFALEGELNFDYYLSTTVSMSVGAAVNMGPLQAVEDNSITLEPFDFNRVDIFGGFRFHF